LRSNRRGFRRLGWRAYPKYLAVAGQTITVGMIKRHEVKAVRAEDGLVARRWSLYQCLQTEISEGDRVHVLSGGTWFAVAKVFTERIREDIGALPEIDLGLPAARRGEHEGAYNARVGVAGRVAILDQQLVRCGGPRTEIEVCDLFTRDLQFIHVKRHGASGVLSHLFAQGRNSAEAFLEEPDFRNGIRQRLQSIDSALIAQIPTSRPDAGRYTVVFAVVDSRAGAVATTLPFLSQITLAQSARYLRAVGYRVALSRIQISS
jgi:uncharacterized protein (TIGR04141 family)